MIVKPFTLAQYALFREPGTIANRLALVVTDSNPCLNSIESEIFKSCGNEGPWVSRSKRTF
jgi:hypothetical protein